CFGSSWQNAGGIGAPLFSSSNRRLSSNGIAKGFGFIGAGNRKQVAPGAQESILKIANLSPGSPKRIPYGASHGFKPNSASSGLRWLNQPLQNTGSKRLSLPPKRGRRSSPITPTTSSASTSSQSPLRRSATFTVLSSSCTRGVKSSISTSQNIRPPPGRPSSWSRHFRRTPPHAS